jgi:hypothetical protein
VRVGNAGLPGLGENLAVTDEGSLDWLHDSRLSAIEVSWSSATATVFLEVDTAAALAGSLPLAGTTVDVDQHDRAPEQSGTLVIECAGPQRVVIPHDEPWGPSDYVNAVRVSEPGELRIEMGSGDNIEILADTVTLNRDRLASLS